MEVRDFEVFLSVTKHLSFTRAGEDVHLSQPSVSVRMHQLERALRVKLFEHIGKRVTLTEAGRLLEPFARRVVVAMEDAQHAIEEYRGLESGSLRIGASTTPGMYLVPKIVALFKHSYPGIKIHLAIKDTRSIEQNVIGHEFDFGFVGGHLIGGELEILPWLKDEIVLVVPPGHRLTNEKVVKLCDLSEEHFVFREHGSATQATVDKQLHAAGIQLEKVMEMGNPEALKQAVQSGLGIAFLSKFAIEAELKAKTLKAVKVRDLSVRRELRIVYRKDKHLHRAAKAFIEIARGKSAPLGEV
jgi:DNA-binding transcriptional LysR family regulator